MTIVPLERRRLSDAAVDQIINLIRSGAFSVGDKLPSERDLAKDLGVSRVLVRESLRALEALGLIEVKRGIGAFVTQQSPVNMQIANYLRSHPTEVLEVVEVRAALAALAGELAAKRLSKDELMALTRLYRAQREAYDAGRLADLPDLDEEFHSIIYAATQNHVLVSMYDHTRSVLDYIRWNHITLMTRTEESLREHERILQALTARDSRASGSALRRHAQRSEADIRKFVRQFGAKDPAFGPDTEP